MKTQTIRSVFENALKNERHDKNSETRFWCGQFKLLAKLAIEQLEQQAIAEAEKQEPLCTAAMFDEWFLAKSGLDPKTPLYTHPQPKREPEAWTPRIERHYKDGVLISQTIQYNPQGEKLPYPHEPKREPIACVIDGKLMAYKNGPLPNDCLLYDQAI